MTCTICAKQNCIDECKGSKALYQISEPPLKGKDVEKSDEQQGVYSKYTVTRNNDTVGKHKDCEYFVLDINHDPYAKHALVSYAAACAATHPELSKDMIQRYGLGVLMSWADREDEYTPAIKQSHPVLTKNYEAYDKALAMVGNRKSKYALVDLVSYLLQKAGL